MRTLTLLSLLALAACADDPASFADATYDPVSMAEAPESTVDLAGADLDEASAEADETAARAPSAPPLSDAAFASRLLLRVSTETHDETLRAARAVAARYGGMVSGEDGSAHDGGSAMTTLTLRVPSDRFDAALDALAALGTVESRAVTVDDVTAQVVDVEARLRAKRAAEARYIGFVAQASSVSEMLEVQARLDAVRAEIESMESQARALRGGVTLATIRATIVGPATVAPLPPAPGLFARAADAIAAGWHGVLAVVFGLLPLWPLAVLGTVGYAVWRRLSPRVAV